MGEVEFRYMFLCIKIIRLFSFFWFCTIQISFQSYFGFGKDGDFFTFWHKKTTVLLQPSWFYYKLIYSLYEELHSFIYTYICLDTFILSKPKIRVDVNIQKYTIRKFWGQNEAVSFFLSTRLSYVKIVESFLVNDILSYSV